MTLTLQELAQICVAKIQNNLATQDTSKSLKITSASDIITAKPTQLTILSNKKYIPYLQKTLASVCLISDQQKIINAPKKLIFLVCADPEISFINAIHALYPKPKPTNLISKQTAIAANTCLGNNINIGAFSVVGTNSSIGDNTEIFSNVTIGNNVKIGKNCCLYPAVVLYDNTQIGDNVILHSGVILGADGFGYKFRNNTHVKVPHVGNVVIENNVEIGANTCIDKATLGSTTIKIGSKIDNLVQIAHNNKIGKNVIICGQSAVSGSCTIKDDVIIAGGVGLADHVTIGQKAVVLARSGVANDIKSGTSVFGSPAKERKTAWRELAALIKLPKLLKKFQDLDKRVNKLEDNNLP